MRPRTFILIVLVLLAGAALVVFFLLSAAGGDLLAGLTGAPTATSAVSGDPQIEEPRLPTPTPTPEVDLVQVVTADVRLPVGTRLTRDLISMEWRPATNVAIRAGYTFSNPDEVIGRIVGTEIAKGEAILDAMLAFSPTDITTFGSDLALQLENGRVAVAFPIDRFSGLGYTLRPGDYVDILMSIALTDLDEEFQTARPNILEQVDQQKLLEGEAFLFEPATEGRLELIPGINVVGVVGPGGGKIRIPRRVTQLTLQQLKVIWVGTWEDPRDQERARADEQAAYQAAVAAAAATATANPEQPPPVIPTPRPMGQRLDAIPDIIIVSLTAQDALVLKWALESQVNINLALRAQGDAQVFLTTSVSLPQAVEQSGLSLPVALPYGLEPMATPIQVTATPEPSP